MRYRRLSYRYAMVVRSGRTWPFGELSQSDRLRLLIEPRWRPDADTHETATTVDARPFTCTSPPGPSPRTGPRPE
jgi:hypothetical protein